MRPRTDREDLAGAHGVGLLLHQGLRLGAVEGGAGHQRLHLGARVSAAAPARRWACSLSDSTVSLAFCSAFRSSLPATRSTMRPPFGQLLGRGVGAPAAVVHAVVTRR